jgi:hypothetical protein
MAIETWVALGASVLLAFAAVTRGMALRSGLAWWDRLAIGARLGAVIILIVALAWLAGSQGGGSPSDFQQMALSLTLAAVCVHLVLIWRLGADGAGPIVDLIALTLVLSAMFAFLPGGVPLSCAQRAISFRLQWILFALGAGSLVVAGSAGLMLALYYLLADRIADWDLLDETDLSACLRYGTVLGLIAIGSGLTVSVWWAWRTAGSLTSGDPREVWMVIAWLVAAGSSLAWQLEKHSRRWAAGLSVVTALIAVLSALVLTNLR